MRKYILFIFTLLAIFSCSNEEEVQGCFTMLESKETTAFVRLADDATGIAGVIKIVADVPEAEVTWITAPICNLDTTQTTVILKNGVGELPVRWLVKQKNGEFAPQATAYKAWVRIKTGDKLTDIPLILSERVDSVGLMRTTQTRAGELLPRVISLSFNPTEVNLQTATGGSCQLVVEGPGNITIDYSGIKDEYKIDKTNLPEVVTGTTTLNFRWLGGVAPTTAFNVAIYASDELFWTSCTLKYDPNGTGGADNLKYVSNSMPATGNLPATSNIYTFNFEGTYTGKVQLRTLSNGAVLYTATAYDYPANQPRARVPENTGAARPITFEYRKGTGAWVAIPEANRVQDGAGGTPPGPDGSPSYGPVSPSGDIPDGGGEYNCVFSNYSGALKFQAISGAGRVLAETSDIIPANGFKQLFLNIPEATSMTDNKVIFQYSVDNGVTWNIMETRTQQVEAFASGYIHNLPNMVPVSGGTYSYTSQGTLSGILTILCQDSGQTILSESKGAAGSTINVVVPANTSGKVRNLFFYLKRTDHANKLYMITHTQQSAE